MTAVHPVGEVRQPDARRAEEETVAILRNGTFTQYKTHRDYIQSIKSECDLDRRFPILRVFETMYQNDLLGQKWHEGLNPEQMGLAEERIPQ